MAKIIIVGSSERKGRFCPQCRKKVPLDNRVEEGVNCPRCGLTRWENFGKYKSLDGVPVPSKENEMRPEDFFETGSLTVTKKKKGKEVKK